MGAGANAQMMVRRLQPQFHEETAGEALVIVLSCVHEHLLDASRLQGGTHRPRLDELGTCADDGDRSHG